LLKRVSLSIILIYSLLPAESLITLSNEIIKTNPIEKESTVIGLMMYIGDPLELKEHLMMPSKSKCLKNKEIAELSSSAYYECAEVNAVVKGGKIIKVIEEIKIFE